MRDYTYYQGARFTVNNIYRSERFDVDRLDMSWVDDEKPLFSRGLRIVDHQEGNTEIVDGECADNLIFSMANIASKDSTKGISSFDQFLEFALKNKNFLITSHSGFRDSKPKDEAIH